MQGLIVWWSVAKSHGVVSVTENGQNQRYFLLLSRIVSAPEQIRAGQYVKFVSAVPPRRPDLLPLASGVTISESPFVDSGADSIRAGALKVGV
jgi:hypothetical protein